MFDTGNGLIESVDSLEQKLLGSERMVGKERTRLRLAGASDEQVVDSLGYGMAGLEKARRIL